VIAGVAEADFKAVEPGTRPEDLMVEASLRALADAGLPLDAVDGLFACTSQLNMPALSAAEQLGIRPRYLDGTNVGGSSFIAHLAHAAAAIEAGRCEVALIVYGSTQRSVGRGNASVQEVDPYEKPYEPMNPVTAYALAASRHMHEFGTTPEQLAEVAVSARRWAQLNPGAWSRDELSIADVLASPRVCDPLGVRDCCLVTDGGAAAVLVRGESGVRLLGVGEATTHRNISYMPDLVRTGAVESGRRAFAEAGVTHDDVDLLMLYDAFTITPILFLEDLGFCAKGEGGAYVEGGRTAPGGDGIPMNTNGGGLSYCHPGMYGLLLIVEAVRQLRGECGERQVDGARVALVHGNGGVLSSQCTALLGLT
jgi:acetyl-CoA acetyltransferase